MILRSGELEDEATFLALLEPAGRPGSGSRGADAAHDVAHFRRVLGNAFRIARELSEPVDGRILHAACWLHDLVTMEKDDPGRGAAAERSAEAAATVLQRLGWSDADRAAVASAIRSHSFSGGGQPATLEAAILRDADRLDALGAVGIARLFHVAGRIGSRICHPDDPLARARPLDDRRYAADHCFAKLSKLREGMVTAPGRRMADERWRLVESFLAALERETAPAGDAGAGA